MSVQPPVELVFRSVGERTSDLALDLACRAIRPVRVHRIEHVTPFAEAVRQMLGIEYSAPQVVFMDADSLIFEDLRPFLNANVEPYVDCYVADRFRGRLHAGVHITRLDVVREMARIQDQIPDDDLRFVLRPESTVRHHALRSLGLGKQLVPFRILHDHGQFLADVFAKYALRELRSRTPENAAKLARAMAEWNEAEPDFCVARHAVEFARASVGIEASAADKHAFIEALPVHAARQLAVLGIEEKPPLTAEEVAQWEVFADGHFSAPRSKTFCIGLSRTGTKTLTSALAILGHVIAHHPSDQRTYDELTRGRYDLTLLGPNGADGLSDLASAAFFAQMDDAFPGSRFILTTRDKAQWLDSMERHWEDKPIFEDEEDGRSVKLQMRRFLRASMYGTYSFSRRRLGYAFDQHHARVAAHFVGRSKDLLEMDVIGGEGWRELCPFLEMPVLDAPFPRADAKAKLGAPLAV